MAFHAVIGPQALKPFTRTLTCLSRYGDDVTIQASPDALILSATNSSKSAYFNVKLTSEFFDKYTLKPVIQPGMTFQTPPEADNVRGQLLVKSLLSILKHKTVETTVHRCDLSIVEGGQDTADTSDDNSEEDSLSSKLILRLHCKHGVVKTHRLLLFTPNSLTAPKIPDATSSQLNVAPLTLRNILNHFPHSRGDPQLAWNFAANNVVLRSVETPRARDRGTAQIATEISLSADEFETYTIDAPPVGISFHLREFNATIALAESLNVSLDMRFTLPAEPIYITFDMESGAEYLFVISTSQKEAGVRASVLKRSRGDDVEDGDVAVKRSAINRASPTASHAAPLPPSQPMSQIPIPHLASVPRQGNEAQLQSTPNEAAQSSDRVPLFLPGASQDAGPPMPASQLSARDLDLVRSAGLGIEHMDYEEFEAMMEAEGEEVGMSTAVLGVRRPEDHGFEAGILAGGSGAETLDDSVDMSMLASQVPPGRYGEKEFRPLFDD